MATRCTLHATSRRHQASTFDHRTGIRSKATPERIKRSAGSTRERLQLDAIVDINCRNFMTKTLKVNNQFQQDTVKDNLQYKDGDNFSGESWTRISKKQKLPGTDDTIRMSGSTAVRP